MTSIASRPLLDTSFIDPVDGETRSDLPVTLEIIIRHPGDALKLHGPQTSSSTPIAGRIIAQPCDTRRPLLHAYETSAPHRTYDAGRRYVGNAVLYRIEGSRGIVAIPGTTTRDESLREVDVEEWVERSPEVLGEDLIIIGRQVELDEGRDRIDLLALDLDANVVVVELKRDLVGGDADLQALRYASMVAGWTEETLRGVAETYWRTSAGDRETFTKELDDFCDAGYEVNRKQRILLVGRHVHPRVATMALWLRESGVDIRVLGIDLYRDGEKLYLVPQTIIPLPTEEDVAAQPGPVAADKEWKRDGPTWHLNQQLADDGRAILEAVIDLVASRVPAAEGPRWEQKNYVTWRSAGRNWIRAYTDNPHQVALMLYGVDRLTPDDVAARVGLPTQQEAESNEVSRVGEGRTRSHVWIVIKTLDDFSTIRDGMGGVLEEAWESFTGTA